MIFRSVLAVVAGLASSAFAADPVKVGFSMALTGGGAANGKVALLALKIWEADVNAKGGLLGRPINRFSGLVAFFIPAIYSHIHV